MCENRMVLPVADPTDREQYCDVHDRYYRGWCAECVRDEREQEVAEETLAVLRDIAGTRLE